MARVTNMRHGWIRILALLFFAQGNFAAAGSLKLYNRLAYEYVNIGLEQDRSALYGQSSLNLSTLGLGDMMRSSPLFASIDAEVQYDYAEQSRSADIRQAYLTLGWRNAFEVGIGENIVIWGKGDEINPTDVINAERFDRFLVETKGRRKLARPMASVRLGLNETYVTLLAMPSRAQHIFPDPEQSRWCLGPCLRGNESTISADFAAKGTRVNFSHIDPERPLAPEIERRYENLGQSWEYAGKIARSFTSLDLSLMVHQGFERLATFTRKFTNPSSLSFQEIPARRMAYGGDFSLDLTHFVLRGEAIIKDHKTFMIAPESSLFRSDIDGIVYATEWEYVVGIDANVFWDIFTSLQYFERGDNSAFSGLIRAAGSKIATLVLRRNFLSEDLTLEYRAMVDTEDASALHLPKATYRFNDIFSASLQGNVFYGRQNTTFGDYFANNGALSSLQVEF